MKKKIYITAFVLLGIIFSFYIHAVVEIWYIGLLLADFERYGFGFSWNTWKLIHHISAVILLFAGILFGFQQGRYWWYRLYETDNFRGRRVSLKKMLIGILLLVLLVMLTVFSRVS